METQKTSTKEEKYLKAKRRLEQLKGFYWHLFVYLLIIPILAVVNYLTTDYPWIIFPAIAWGFAVAIHWFSIFVRHTIFSDKWEARKIQEYMDEDVDQQKQLYN